MKRVRLAIQRPNGWELTVVSKDGRIQGPYTQLEIQPRQAQVCQTEQEYRAAIRESQKEREE